MTPTDEARKRAEEKLKSEAEEIASEVAVNDVKNFQFAYRELALKYSLLCEEQAKRLKKINVKATLLFVKGVDKNLVEEILQLAKGEQP